MGRYITFYKWKPENVRAFAKRYVDAALGVGPKEIVEAMRDKWKWYALEYALGNHFITVIWEAKDEDLPAMHAALMWMEEVCTVETYPVMNMEEHGKAWEILEEVLDKTA
ncbi:MAG: hypothetical protein ACFFCS_28220 [Candidatus Hodarchaeota archaeon]